MPVAAPSLEEILEPIPSLLSETQSTLVNHRKNGALLRKIHVAAAAVTQPGRKKTSRPDLVGERAFNDEVTRCLERVVAVKKGVVVADRVIKFIASYVALITPDAKGAWAADRARRGPLRRVLVVPSLAPAISSDRCPVVHPLR